MNKLILGASMVVSATTLLLYLLTIWDGEMSDFMAAR